MKLPGALPWIRAAIFLAISVLVLAGTGFLIGRRETVSFPSALSDEPSGVSALRAYIQDLGYRTEVARRSSLVVPMRSTVIAFYPGQVRSVFRQDRELDYRNQRRKILAHARAGNTVILVGMPFAFSERSAEAYRRPPAKAVGARGQASKVINPILPLEEDEDDGDETVSDEVFFVKDSARVFTAGTGTDESPFLVNVATYGRGRILAVNNGMLWTNRFLADHDHVAILSGILRVLAPKSDPVVFLEGTFNPHDPGLLEVLGPWAKSALNQTLFVLIVVGVGLGRFLGRPETERRAQRGQRELLDGLGDFLHRVTDHANVTEVLVRQAEQQLRAAKRLGRDERLADRLLEMPPDLQSSYASLIRESEAEPDRGFQGLRHAHAEDPFFLAAQRFDRAVQRAVQRT
ncbi:MAG: DUF4350 domain-containing protein [Fimbriimonadaceae bacterium]|nr:DUF4350 domain-containing protein [Fimbriimonadaceae bacterium]